MPDEGAALPVTAAEFDAAMRAFAPFPRRPEIAVALSGGADSMALLVLLRAWITARGGALFAFIVDHRLRRESAAEAARVAARAAALGIEAQILVWQGAKPSSGIQAKARAARYRLLEAACRARGLLYLATGHHSDDQAETFLLRLESGSGPTGLAGMSALAVRQDVLLLRPLLAFPKARLEAVLRADAIAWVEDPSNRDPRHRRVALRQQRSALATQGLTAEVIQQTRGLVARMRRALECEVLVWLAQVCDWRTEGYVVIARAALQSAHAGLVGPALALVLRSIGGTAYAPSHDRVVGLLADVQAGRGSTTLAGCRLVLDREWLYVVRESRATQSLALQAGRTQQWDRRFRLICGPDLAPDLYLKSLTEAGWRRMHPRPDGNGLPLAVLCALPSVWDEAGPLVVPHLHWQRRDVEPESAALALSLRFQPLSRPGSAVFAVA